MSSLNKLAASRAVKDTIFLTILLEAFFIGLSQTTAIVFMGIGIALFLFRWWKDPNFHVKATTFHWPLIVYLLCSAASILVSPDKIYTLTIWFVLVIIYFLTYVLVTQNVEDCRQIRLLTYSLGASAAIIVAYGFFQFIFGIDTSEMKWVDGEAFPELSKRVFSTLENPNILAAYLDMVVCVLLGLFGTLTEKRTRIALGVAMVCTLGCVAMTYARGACLTIAFIMAVYGILKDKRILAGVAVLVAGFLLLNPVLFERMSTMFTVVDTSSEMRIAMWESTVQMILDHPILGIGGGAYSLVYPIYDTYIVDGSVTLVHAHNIYLNYLAEIGIVGGCAFLVFFLGYTGTALYPQKTMPDEFSKGLMLGLGLALVSVALNGLTDDVLYNVPSSMYLWMICGLVYVMKEKI
ncbi:O-antigen ligase [Anaerovibrio sp. RM50]|uniref:O-antigen ligase family protein n=1 Tax=Anaerovibrio sp. RM50 TaxID=1200557 RepID=UPI000688AD1C|nr:O-antigen ligase family protein [Anaerovibrio sp. RM50]